MGAHLGQHFLKNKEKLRNIAHMLALKQNECVIEIGPGHGELTREILKSAPKNIDYIVIEKDGTLAENLRAAHLPIKVVEGDVLTTLPTLTKNFQTTHTSYKIVGNIPYYITGKLLRVIGDLEHKPSQVVLTVQQEVAERVCAKAPYNNLLAASIAWWATSEIIQYIPKEDFAPLPKVRSATLLLTTKKLTQEEIAQTSAYYACIKALFRHPRKTILNNFCEGIGLTKEEGIKKLSACNINPKDRPQTLTLTQHKALTALLLLQAQNLSQPK